MGLFDKLFSSSTTTFTYEPQSEQEAWIAIMYACIAVDGDVSDVEIDKLSQLVVPKSIFIGRDIVQYYKTAMLAHKQVGSKILIDNSVLKVNDNNKLTLFAIVMELLLADGVLGEKEKEIAEYLTNSLKLSAENAQKIVEILLIKNKDNIALN